MLGGGLRTLLSFPGVFSAPCGVTLGVTIGRAIVLSSAYLTRWVTSWQMTSCPASNPTVGAETGVWMVNCDHSVSPTDS